MIEIITADITKLEVDAIVNAALRRSASYGGHPSPAPLHSAYFCKQKKSTDSKTGLPSVALAKDGGGLKNSRTEMI